MYLNIYYVSMYVCILFQLKKLLKFINCPTSVLRQTMWFIGNYQLLKLIVRKKLWLYYVALGWHNFTLY